MKKSDRSFFKHAKNNKICFFVFRKKKTHVKTPRVLLAYPNIFTAFGPKKSLEKPTKPNRFFGQRWPGKLTPNDNQNAKLPTSNARLPTFSQPFSEGKLFCLLVLIREFVDSFTSCTVLSKHLFLTWAIWGFNWVRNSDPPVIGLMQNDRIQEKHIYICWKIVNVSATCWGKNPNLLQSMHKKHVKFERRKKKKKTYPIGSMEYLYT